MRVANRLLTDARIIYRPIDADRGINRMVSNTEIGSGGRSVNERGEICARHADAHHARFAVRP